MNNNTTGENVSPEQTNANPAADVNTTLAAQIAQSIETGVRAAVQAMQPERQVSYPEFLQRSTSSPRRAKVLTRRYTQNGYDLNRAFHNLSDVELALLEELPGGSNLGLVRGLVNIVETAPNGPAGEKHVAITYKSGTLDARMALKNEVRSFEELLRRCIADAQAAGAAKREGRH